MSLRYGGRWALISALAILVSLPLAAPAAETPAKVFDRTTCNEVRDLLPASVLAWLCQGDFTLALGSLTYAPRWEPAFVTASEANDGRYDVDADGGLIDRGTGARPLHTYGWPFPHIDAGDPNAGIKILWNVAFLLLKTGAVHVPAGFEWIARNGFERRIHGDFSVLPFDGQPTAVDNPRATEERQLFRGVSPADVEGSTTLTWRYMDNRPDAVWAYLPSVRRIRELTAANRSDPIFGSDLVQDDAGMWGGKNQSFRWKLVGQQDVLVSTVTADLVRLVAGPHGPNGQEWRTPRDYPGARLGYETPHWSGAPWLLTNAVWIKRPVWIVEGHPKDPYYNYGRQVFYIDRETYKIYYKIVYTPSGEYWKTILNDFGWAESPDGTQRQFIAAAAIGVDERADHATYATGAGPKVIGEYNSVRLTPELFTLSGLMRLGK